MTGSEASWSALSQTWVRSLEGKRLVESPSRFPKREPCLVLDSVALTGWLQRGERGIVKEEVGGGERGLIWRG